MVSNESIIRTHESSGREFYLNFVYHTYVHITKKDIYLNT